MTRLSVVIPTLDERVALPEAVASIPPGAEIVVVDGGSADGTREWVRSQPGLRLVDAARGRGTQLAAGASAATGDTLLFLHADCRLPEGAGGALAAALEDPRVVGGCFRVRFAGPVRPALAWTAAAINTHTRCTRTATGDQAIFVRRADHDALGGFRPWPLFEDVDFVERLRRRGRFVVLPEQVTLSARRWEAHGVGRTNLLMVRLWLDYRRGVAPDALKRRYADVRPARRR